MEFGVPRKYGTPFFCRHKYCFQYTAIAGIMEKIQMMQKRILDFIEIIGGIFLVISLLLRVQFDMKVPAWITIICILIVTVAFLFNFVLAKKLDRK